MLLMHMAAFADFIPLTIYNGWVQGNKEAYFDTLGACKSWAETEAHKLTTAKLSWRDCSLTSQYDYCSSFGEGDENTWWAFSICTSYQKCPDNSRTHRKRNDKGKIEISCTCDSGYVEKDRACILPPEEKKCPAKDSIGPQYPYNTPVGYRCEGGCIVEVSRAVVDSGCWKSIKRPF